MPILLKTRVERTAKTPIKACHARVGGLCGFHGAAERVPAESRKTGRCADVQERWRDDKHRKERPRMISDREQSRKRRSRRKA